MLNSRDPGVMRGRPRFRHVTCRRGVTAIDVIVLVVLVIFVFLLILMFLPRGREHARMASCESNLAHIGFGIQTFDVLEKRLPGVEGAAASESSKGARPKSVVRVILEAIEQPDFLILKDGKSRPEARPGSVPGDVAVPGFVCASDPNATARHFGAPISYRACTGDSAAGDNGAFAIARTMSLKEIEERDGMSFTAVFSERLVGDNVSGHMAAMNYMISDQPLNGGECPAAADSTRWRGDAGSSWVASDYRSTLYNHAIAPNGRPSCIEDSGAKALMGASSGHLAGVNVLFADGHVATVTTTVNRVIWKEFARIRPREDVGPVKK